MRNLKRTRNLFVGVGFVALLAVLAVGQAVLEKTAAAQSKAGVQAPRFEVDPLWPKPLPESLGPRTNHRRLGRYRRSRLDRPSQLRHAGRQREGHRDEDRECAAARARRRSSSSIRRATCCGTGADRARRVRVARRQPRHLHRLQGQRLDRRQRRARFPHPEVHQGRQVPAAGRQEGRAPQGGRGRGQPGRPGRRLCRRQQRPGELRPRREDLRRPRKRTRPTSPTAI